MPKLFLRFDIGVCLVLMVACLCAAAPAQTIEGGRRGKGAAQQSGSLPSSGSPPVAVSPGDWSQLAKFSELDYYEFCCLEFGTRVAISGDTVVVSDPQSNVRETPYFVFVKPANGWTNATPTAALKIPGAKYGNTSGAVAIDGDTIVVGGPTAAYVFVKPAGGWATMNPTAELKASDGAPIGGALAISGSTIVAADAFAHSRTGAAYLFVQPAGGWKSMTQTAKLTASDGGPNDYFGAATGVDGTTVVVSATEPLGFGKVYVFVEPAGGWTDTTQTAELTASDLPRGSELGGALSISGGQVLAGGAYYYGQVLDAYMFVKPPGGWVNATETAKLSPADPNPEAEYGLCVAVSGNLAAVGSRGFSHDRFISEGGVYVFSKPTDGWHDMSSRTVVTGSDARHASSFGTSVALSGKSLVVGAPWITYHSAYLFGLP